MTMNTFIHHTYIHVWMWTKTSRRDVQRGPTIDKVMRISFNLAKQKVYLKEKPLVVMLSAGEHVAEGSFTSSYGRVRENTL